MDHKPNPQCPSFLCLRCSAAPNLKSCFCKTACHLQNNPSVRFLVFLSFVTFSFYKDIYSLPSAVTSSLTNLSGTAVHVEFTFTQPSPTISPSFKTSDAESLMRPSSNCPELRFNYDITATHSDRFKYAPLMFASILKHRAHCKCKFGNEALFAKEVY